MKMKSKRLKFYVIALVAIVVLVTIFSGSKIGPHTKYDCDVKNLRLSTDIEISADGEEICKVSGNIFRIVEDPLTMKDPDGNKLAYAGDTDLLRIADVLTQYGDYDAFLESFSNVFLQSIETDDEKPVRLGRYALKAIKDNSLDDFLIAICGWSLESLMKKALIIPDVESQFHKEIEEATFVSIWDDDIRQEAPCKVNTRTREIFDIEHSSSENEEEVYECNGEFVMIDGIEFPAIPQDEFECGRKLAFWYGENE